jgi:cold shock CspA family protein
VIAEAHYVRGRTALPSRAFDKVLEESGVSRHDVAAGPEGRKKGVDVYLALETWDRAAAGQLDFVALITGDADLTPLVVRLRGQGVQVLVPVVDAEFADPRTGGLAQLHTAGDLRTAATDTVDLDALLQAALADGYPLRYPFATPASDVGRGTTGPAGQRRLGTITRWRPGETFGFLTSSEGTSWFVSADSLPSGYKDLAENTAVTFAGSATPAPGRRYPQAYTVTPLDDDE